MSNRKYVETCCISCGREAWAWHRDQYPLCDDCDTDSLKNVAHRNRFKKKSQTIEELNYSWSLPR